MEEGSLLHDVLHRRGGGRGVRFGGDGPTRGTLTVDVRPVSPNERLQLQPASSRSASASGLLGDTSPPAHETVVRSAWDPDWEILCTELNAFLESTSSVYPWFIRRPTFFVPLEPSDDGTDPDTFTRPLQSLRAIVEYGLQITDEWMMIHLMLTFTGRNPHLQLAVECWDDDDGQILLIEAARALPDWVDSVDCRHRCWIHAGQVKLLSPASVPAASVESALSYIHSLSLFRRPDAEQEVNQSLTEEIQSAIHTRVSSVPHTHRAPVYLPRSVVDTLLKSHSSLVGGVVAAFVDQALSQPSPGTLPHKGVFSSQDKSRFPAMLRSSDWVWTSFVFGRTHYAILRQFCSPSWPVCDEIPSWFVSYLSEQQAELEQQNMSSLFNTLHGLGMYPPHVKSGICIGVRLVAGLLHCLVSSSVDSSVDVTMSEYQAKQEWKHLNIDIERWTSAQNDMDGSSSDDKATAGPPLRPLEDEDWMNVTEEEMKRLTTIAGRAGLESSKHSLPQDSAPEVESILGGVRGFLNRKSDAFGVETTTSERTKVRVGESPRTLLPTFEIDPVVVLNVLHAALKAPTADELVVSVRPNAAKSSPSDPFFSEQDYDDFMDEGSAGNEARGDNDDSSTTSSISDGEEYEPAGVNEDGEMRNLMNAMDRELHRAMDVSSEDVRNVDDPETIESMHLLSNLLQSLESSSGPGAAGPLQSMLAEMGIQTPDLWSPTKQATSYPGEES